MILFFVAASLARPVDPAAPEARLSSVLADAWHTSADPAAHAAFTARRPRFADGAQVVVELVPGADGAALAAALGLEVEAAVGPWVQLRVPLARLGELAARPEVRHVREPHRPAPKVTSEGYAATMLTDWHANDQVTGAGVTVAVLDVGFDGYESLLGEELPASVTTDFSRGAADQTDHGAAVAEVVHDFAPDAELTLASFSTEVEFGEALQALLDAQTDVVNASVGFDNVWPADGTSPVTQYVDGMVEAGVIMVTAAGNEAQRYRVGELSAEEGSQYINIGDHYAFRINAPEGRVRVTFRWSEPFGEAGTDLDLVAFDGDDTTQHECGRSENPQDGNDDPFEELDLTGCTGETVYVAVYTTLGTDVSGLTGHLYAMAGLADGEPTIEQSLSLPADCFGCLAIGAYNVDDDSIPAWSSRGPTDDGRTKPDFVAPQGVSTATLGEAGFTGSSAAVPHAAGLAALWVQATGLHSDPAAFGEWAADGARDLGESGFDTESGRGALSANEIPGACGCAATTGAALPAIVAAAGLFATRRRRR